MVSESSGDDEFMVVIVGTVGGGVAFTSSFFRGGVLGLIL